MKSISIIYIVNNCEIKNIYLYSKYQKIYVYVDIKYCGFMNQEILYIKVFT